MPEQGAEDATRALTRRLIPFLGVGLLVLVAAYITSDGVVDSVAFAGAGLAAALLIAAMYALPWARIAEWHRTLLPIGWLAVVYLLEQSFGSGADVAPLALLTVVWFALYGTRRDFFVALVAAPAAVLLPHATGVYMGSASEPFGEAATVAMITTLVGVTVHGLVHRLREHVQLQQTSAAVAHRMLVDGTDTRYEICAAASGLGGAGIAWLVEPDSDGGLVSTARVGPGPQRVRWELTDEESGVVRAFVTGTRRFVPDARASRGVSKALVEATGARSVLFEPVIRDDRPVGVLVVAWTEGRRRLSTALLAAISLLAAEAAIGLERADRVRELRDAREAAERTRDEMNDLLIHVSHDLRTPLNAVLGFAAVAQRSELDAAGRDAIGRIEVAGEHMLKLVQDMLKLRWTEGTREQLEASSVSVADVVAAAFVLLEERAGARLVSLEGPTSDDHVVANPEQLLRVMVNLLENAIEYGNEEGYVSVSTELRSEQGHVRITVSDDGPGIERSLLPHLFEPFIRHGEREDGQGTGLGLAACRAAVERMSGTIEVESVLGHGSAFSIELPAVQADVEPSGVPVAVGLSPRPRHSPEADLAALAVPGTKLLYVEDNPTNQALVAVLLEDYPGLEVIGASTGEEGLDLAREQTPDAILVDLSLPGMSGAEVIDALDESAETRRIPVAILSASADVTGGVSSISLRHPGGVGFLGKPFHVDDLFELIASMLSRSPARSAGGDQDQLAS